MKRSLFGRRRIAVIVVALGVLAIGVSVGLAKSGPSQISSTLHLRDNGDCPPPGATLKPSRGTVQITNVKGTWTIVVHMHGALPGTYHIDLRDTNCTSFKTQLSQFKVKSDGSGDTSATYFAGNRQSFYLRVHDNDQAISYYAPLLKIGGNP